MVAFGRTTKKQQQTERRDMCDSVSTSARGPAGCTGVRHEQMNMSEVRSTEEWVDADEYKQANGRMVERAGRGGD